MSSRARKRKRENDEEVPGKRRRVAEKVVLRKRTREQTAKEERSAKRARTVSESATPDGCFDQLLETDGGDVLGIEEFEKLATQMGVDSTDLVLMAFAWRCRPAGKFCRLSRAEFVRGMSDLGCKTFDDLRSKLSVLREFLANDDMFKEFYEFMFDWAKENQKLLGKDMARGMWPLLLGRISKFVSPWERFVEAQSPRGITKDCWMQTLEFMKIMHDDEDIANYDFSAFWPSMIDEFVLGYQKEHNIESNQEQVMTL